MNRARRTAALHLVAEQVRLGVKRAGFLACVYRPSVAAGSPEILEEFLDGLIVRPLGLPREGVRAESQFDAVALLAKLL